MILLYFYNVSQNLEHRKLQYLIAIWINVENISEYNMLCVEAEHKLSAHTNRCTGYL